MAVDNYSVLMDFSLELIIPAWFIAVGALNWGSCPHEPLLPMWSIFGGSVGVALAFSILYKQIKVGSFGKA